MNKDAFSKIKDIFDIDCNSDAHKISLLIHHETKPDVFRTYVFDCFEQYLEDSEYKFISIEYMLSQLTVSADPLVFKNCKTHMVRIGDNTSSDTDSNSEIIFEVVEIANLKPLDLYASGSLSIKHLPIGLFEKILTSSKYQDIVTRQNYASGFHFTFGKRLSAKNHEILEVMFTFQYILDGTSHTAYFDYSED
jgi:hypothetical protein